MDMKHCSKCDQTKSLESFWGNKNRNDGKDSFCIECRKDYKQRNRERLNKYRRDLYYSNRDLELARTKSYRQTEKGKLSARTSVETYQINNPEKKIARMAVNNAIKRKEMFRPSECGRCGRSDLRIEGHHADYTKILEVEWLCSKCHNQHHAQYGKSNVI